MSSRLEERETRHPGPCWTAGEIPINVGSYTNVKPVIDKSQCSSCLLCWLLCPDGAISMGEEDNKPTVNHNLCKSCGICVYECPLKIIKLQPIEKLNCHREL